MFQVFSSGIPFSGPRVCVHLSECYKVSSGRSPLDFRVQFSRSRSQASGASASCPRSRAGSGRSPQEPLSPPYPATGLISLCGGRRRGNAQESGYRTQTEQLRLCLLRSRLQSSAGAPTKCRVCQQKYVSGSTHMGVGAGSDLVVVGRRAPGRKLDYRTGSEQVGLCLGFCDPPPLLARDPGGARGLPGRARAPPGDPKRSLRAPKMGSSGLRNQGLGS